MGDNTCQPKYKFFFVCTAEHSIDLRSVVDLKSSPSAGLAKHIPHQVAKIPYTQIIRPTLEIVLKINI